MLEFQSVWIFFVIVCTCRDTLANPTFAEPILNKTAILGRSVGLSCVINNLGVYTVSWFHRETGKVLTLDTISISSDPRYRAVNNGNNVWWLHIDDIHEDDAGEYICQINTIPMRRQSGYLNVIEPLQIVQSTMETTVDEGEDVILKCLAKGSPEPTITWRREDGEQIIWNGIKLDKVDGPYLHISNVSWIHIGTYLCTATNGISPEHTERNELFVNFKPVIVSVDYVTGLSIGDEIISSCWVFSYPEPLIYWQKGSEILVPNDPKCTIDVRFLNLYEWIAELKISDIDYSDFGVYTCIATNPLGEAKKNFTIRESVRETTKPNIILKEDYIEVKEKPSKKEKAQHVIQKDNSTALFPELLFQLLSLMITFTLQVFFI